MYATADAGVRRFIHFWFQSGDLLSETKCLVSADLWRGREFPRHTRPVSYVSRALCVWLYRRHQATWWCKRGFRFEVLWGLVLQMNQMNGCGCVCVMVGVALRICKLAKGEWNVCFLLFYFFSGKNNANYEQRHSRTHTNVRIRWTQCRAPGVFVWWGNFLV